MESRTGSRGKLWLFAFLSASFGLVLHVGTLNGPFLEFDDQYFIQTDQAIRNPGLEELVIIFTEPYFANYHPVTRLSFAVDYALWEFEPKGYHATSLVLYGLGCGLVFFLLHRMLRHPWAAFMGALLFAAHTTHVEVVAWLSARKDLLCLVFGVSALLLFMKLREKKRVSLYVGMLFCCLLAGWSKSLAVVLPVLFFFMDLIWFRRKKFKEYLDLVPVFLLMAGVGAYNAWAQWSVGAVKSEPLPLYAMGKVTFDYLWKTVLPLNLSARYVLSPDEVKGFFSVLGLLILVALIGTAVFLDLRRHRLFPFAILFWLVPLLPVSNVIPLSTPMADRYLFWPSLAWCLLAGGWLKVRPLKAGYVLCVILLVAYSGLTWSRCKVWLDDELLWKDALKENPKNHYALTALANRSLEEGRQKEAGDYLRRAFEAGGQWNSGLLLSYGKLLGLEGRKEEALEVFKKAYDLEGPKGWFSGRAAHNVGLMMSELGRFEEAESWFLEALSLSGKTQESPTHIRLSIAKVYFETGRFEKARSLYSEICRDAPKDPRPRFYLGLARERMGEYEKALADFEAALDLDVLPKGVSFDYGNVHLMLGKVYHERLNKPDIALEHFRKVLTINPNHPQRQALEQMIRHLSR